MKEIIYSSCLQYVKLIKKVLLTCTDSQGDLAETTDNSPTLATAEQC